MHILVNLHIQPTNIKIISRWTTIEGHFKSQIPEWLVGWILSSCWHSLGFVIHNILGGHMNPDFKILLSFIKMTMYNWIKIYESLAKTKTKKKPNIHTETQNKSLLIGSRFFYDINLTWLWQAQGLFMTIQQELNNVVV